MVIADGRHLFFRTINTDLYLHKVALCRGVLVAKIEKSAYICTWLKGLKIDINFCGIKLHEFCEFDQKNLTKLNILNCFPSDDITL